MFTPRKAVSVGLASAVLLAGCGTETVGNSIISPNGECLAGKTTLELGPTQSVYLGGDLKVDDTHGVEDSLKLQNAGKGVLDVVRSHGDEGTLDFPSNGTSVEPNPNEDNSTNFSFRLNKEGIEAEAFDYAEDTTSISVSAGIDGNNIEITLDTSCVK